MRWLYRALCAALLGLVVASVALHLRGASARGPDPTRGLLAATFSAKVAVLGGAAGAAAGDDLVVQSLDQAAREGGPSYRARALRRKAIWCDFRGKGCAPEALDALDRIPAADRQPAPPDEVAVLREALAAGAEEPGAAADRVTIAPERVEPLLARLGEIRLGWFDHLLRERLYRHAGDAARADRELAEARSGAIGARAQQRGHARGRDGDAVGVSGSAGVGPGAAAWPHRERPRTW
jgi:hypothetical protein